MTGRAGKSAEVIYQRAPLLCSPPPPAPGEESLGTGSAAAVPVLAGPVCTLHAAAPVHTSSAARRTASSRTVAGGGDGEGEIAVPGLTSVQSSRPPRQDAQIITTSATDPPISTAAATAAATCQPLARSLRRRRRQP